MGGTSSGSPRRGWDGPRTWSRRRTAGRTGGVGRGLVRVRAGGAVVCVAATKRPSRGWSSARDTTLLRGSSTPPRSTSLASWHRSPSPVRSSTARRQARVVGYTTTRSRGGRYRQAQPGINGRHGSGLPVTTIRVPRTPHTDPSGGLATRPQLRLSHRVGQITPAVAGCGHRHHGRSDLGRLTWTRHRHRGRACLQPPHGRPPGVGQWLAVHPERRRGWQRSWLHVGAQNGDDGFLGVGHPRLFWGLRRGRIDERRLQSRRHQRRRHGPYQQHPRSGCRSPAWSYRWGAVVLTGRLLRRFTRQGSAQEFSLTQSRRVFRQSANPVKVGIGGFICSAARLVGTPALGDRPFGRCGLLASSVPSEELLRRSEGRGFNDRPRKGLGDVLESVLHDAVVGRG